MGAFVSNDHDYASNAKANTGVTLGSIGLGLGVLNAMGANCGNGGLLGGLFGNNCARNSAELQYVSQLQAENAMLKAENYADKVGKETYMQSLADNRALRDEMYAFIKPLADEAAQNRVNIATLAAEQKCCCEKQELREQILTGKINEVALTTAGRFNALDQTIACLAGKVDGITKTIVPTSAICPQPMPLFNSWTAPTGSSNGQSGNAPLSASNVVGK